MKYRKVDLYVGSVVISIRIKGHIHALNKITMDCLTAFLFLVTKFYWLGELLIYY